MDLFQSCCARTLPMIGYMGSLNALEQCHISLWAFWYGWKPAQVLLMGFKKCFILSNILLYFSGTFNLWSNGTPSNVRVPTLAISWNRTKNLLLVERSDLRLDARVRYIITVAFLNRCSSRRFLGITFKRKSVISSILRENCHFVNFKQKSKYNFILLKLWLSYFCLHCCRGSLLSHAIFRDFEWKVASFTFGTYSQKLSTKDKLKDLENF